MQHNAILTQGHLKSAQPKRQAPHVRVSAECKRRLAVLDERMGRMSDAELFAAAELAKADLGW
jgi:hypothetical protein